MSSARAPHAFMYRRRMPARRRPARRFWRVGRTLRFEVAELKARGVKFEEYDISRPSRP